MLQCKVVTLLHIINRYFDQTSLMILSSGASIELRLLLKELRCPVRRDISPCYLVVVCLTCRVAGSTAARDDPPLLFCSPQEGTDQPRVRTEACSWIIKQPLV